MKQHEYAVILAGGIGSRFWPLSRVNKPKQFLDVLNTGKSLLQWTFERFNKFIPSENIYVVTIKNYVNKVEEQLPEVPRDNIVAEPSRKNTAPCIAYIAYKLYKKDAEAKLICSPADHLILDGETFSSICQEGMEFIEKEEVLLTLGIQPSRPDTGYGYIQFNSDVPVNGEVFKVRTFTEKPDLELARTFMESGDFLWNAGIFLWRADAIIRAFKAHQPEMSELFEQAFDSLNTLEEADVMEFVYSQCTNISIDYAVMEKADNVYVKPADFGWSDLGTWNSAYEALEKDYLNNAVRGNNVHIVDATQCMVNVPNEKLVVLQGLDDFIVVDTGDVLLVCKKDKQGQIKDIIAGVKRNKGEKFL